MAYLYVCLSKTCVQWPQRPEGGVGSQVELPIAVSHRTGFLDLNPGPMDDQLMLLIAELFL